MYWFPGHTIARPDAMHAALTWLAVRGYAFAGIDLYPCMLQMLSFRSNHTRQAAMKRKHHAANTACTQSETTLFSCHAMPCHAMPCHAMRNHRCTDESCGIQNPQPLQTLKAEPPKQGLDTTLQLSAQTCRKCKHTV
jgi:hypothetical protein